MKKKKKEKKGTPKETGHGVTDSQKELDSDPCKLATPQLKTSGTLELYHY